MTIVPRLIVIYNILCRTNYKLVIALYTDCRHKILANLEYPQKSFRSYSASFLSLSKAINSDSFMDLDMHVYLENFQ